MRHLLDFLFVSEQKKNVSKRIRFLSVFMHGEGFCRILGKPVLFLFVLALGSSAYAELPDSVAFERRVYSSDVGSLPYRIMFPENYDPGKKYPLVIFLHGSGERGSDNAKQLLQWGAVACR
uniref:CAZy families CE1 protein n=1 Tax=uncultured Chitinophaga sp. TaxID=339340 RepID=A0A060BN34_9BACT|nr:CAZy families CE1 protein [uncultured Chitinophaga sp.]